MTITVDSSEKRVRKFVAADFAVTDWEHLKPYFDQLLDAKLETLEEVEEWLRTSSELGFVVAEEKAWRFIRMTCDTLNESVKQRYEQFSSEIMPQLSIQSNELLKKLYGSPAFKLLPAEQYKVLTRSVKNRIELFREENVPLNTELRRRSREFDEVASGMFIEEAGEQMTLQRAGMLLESNDRSLRERVWRKVTTVRLASRDRLHSLFSDLVDLRQQVANNAGFESYADYKFEDLGRFDYSREDCYAFHNAIERVVKPMLIAQSRKRQAHLGLSDLRHWDLSVDEYCRPPLKPFLNGKELIEGSIRILDRLGPEIGEKLRIMQRRGFLDLESRLGKAPGGYNYSLPESGVPFIFMNAVGTQADLITMLHEAGHALHSFATHHIDISEFKNMPAELAELASMSMELLTMDFLDELYEDSEDRRRARREQLMRPLTLLPWIAAIDAFQFWAYDNPKHSIEEREEAWKSIFLRFHGDYVSWEGDEAVLRTLWQKQGHIYDVPFYYIEYGIAQLGALAVWRNYRQDTASGLTQYLEALEMGYSRPIPEVYATAGIRFDFSESYVREIMDFVAQEIAQLDGDPA